MIDGDITQILTEYAIPAIISICLFITFAGRVLIGRFEAMLPVGFWQQVDRVWVLSSLVTLLFVIHAAVIEPHRAARLKLAGDARTTLQAAYFNGKALYAEICPVDPASLQLSKPDHCVRLAEHLRHIRHVLTETKRHVLDPIPVFPDKLPRSILAPEMISEHKFNFLLPDLQFAERQWNQNMDKYRRHHVAAERNRYLVPVRIVWFYIYAIVFSARFLKSWLDVSREKTFAAFQRLS